MRRPILLLAAALVLSSCPIGDGPPPAGLIPGSTVPDSTLEADGPIPPGADLVLADFVDGGVAYRVQRLSENCIRVEATPEGRKTRVEDACAHLDELAATGDCYERGDLGACSIELDYWLVGRMPPGAAYVCVANLDGDIGPVRFLEPLPDGLIVARAIRGEAPYPHYFNTNRGQFGEPPLDAPSSVIYALCSDVGPWRTGIEEGAAVRVAQKVEIHFEMPPLAAGTFWTARYERPDGTTEHWQARFGDWSPTEGLGGYLLFPLDLELSSEGHTVTVALPPPPERLQKGDRVAIVDLTGVFVLDVDGHVLDLDPDRMRVTWMSWDEWWSQIEGDG